MSSRFSYQEISVPSANGEITNIRVPIVNQDDRIPSFSRSPEWMVKMDDLLNSSVENFAEYAEVFGWSGTMSRNTSPYLSSDLHTTSTLVHTDLAIIIPMSGYAAKLNMRMAKGMKISKITLVRLGNIEDVKQIIQQIDFEICRIQSIQQSIDQLSLTIQVQKRTDTVNVYKQDGSNSGKVVSTVDFSTMSVKDGG